LKGVESWFIESFNVSEFYKFQKKHASDNLEDIVDFPSDFLFDYRRLLRISDWIGVTKPVLDFHSKGGDLDVSPTIGEVLSNLELKKKKDFTFSPQLKWHSTKKNWDIYPNTVDGRNPAPPGMYKTL